MAKCNQLTPLPFKGLRVVKCTWNGMDTGGLGYLPWVQGTCNLLGHGYGLSCKILYSNNLQLTLCTSPALQQHTDSLSSWHLVPLKTIVHHISLLTLTSVTLGVKSTLGPNQQGLGTSRGYKPSWCLSPAGDDAVLSCCQFAVIICDMLDPLTQFNWPSSSCVFQITVTCWRC